MEPDPDTGHSETARGAAVEQLLATRGRHLMQAAIALAGSRPDGEDLLQAALERLLRNYRRVDSDAEGYLRRTLYNLAEAANTLDASSHRQSKPAASSVQIPAP